MRICTVMIALGVLGFTIGAIKSIKSKFTDLIALIWIWCGVGLLNIGFSIMGILLS